MMKEFFKSRSGLYLKNISGYVVTVVLCSLIFGIDIPWLTVLLFAVVFIIVIEMDIAIKKKRKQTREKRVSSDNASE
ncbi:MULTISPECIES: hypothetical protein [Paenibacillus]|uniref:Uncharacterized protein n=2 Tax=Paenibacillus TaxID=44249 RepID=A0A7Y6BVA8_9BACL|nr:MULTISPECIES: hypothetical protein [Paenibacillus]KGP81980.1 hypothetical protein P364_0114270 [Paenibacillus sp. MAEPY2]KGP86066.1 hypothetical protein P363_0119745 [Paenibacillus sp. MAEPY1]MDN4603899.1 hypothetical protein [Paenibacillus vandeheii]NUU74599.1 hypothetical protein [Paenibacillus xylanilyticus]